MKKKLFSFILAFAFVLTGTICLTACSNSNKGVDMFGKTYTLKTVATYSLTDGGNVLDMDAWITEHFDELSDSFKYEKTNAQDLIAYLKSAEFETYLNTTYQVVLLKGATIEIGEGTKTGEGEDKKGSFKVTWGEDNRIDTTEITAHNGSANYDKYYNGFIRGGVFTQWTSAPGFELTDYDVKDGAIRDLKVRFKDRDNKDYTNYTGITLVSGDGTVSATFNIVYSLASVN